ncbi:MAG: hypothetical protein M3449_04240 [Acidobacteriota bacterium]|nr:hypothetical protein [Blastocatellia bacterium]MDQ3490262.1 hypothetical protein [Acidobacteriota bacterium]
MEQITTSGFKHQLNQTGIASLVLIAASAIPTTNYQLPPSDRDVIPENRRFADLKFQFLSELSDEQLHVQILDNFASALLESLVDTDPEIALITRKRFFDMYEDF